jgi:hypothetical protein
LIIEQEGGSHWIAAHGWWLADVQTYGDGSSGAIGACTPTLLWPKHV